MKKQFTIFSILFSAAWLLLSFYVLAAQAVSLSSISPNPIYEGEILTINGQGFSYSSCPDGNVFLNGKRRGIYTSSGDSWTDSQIKFRTFFGEESGDLRIGCGYAFEFAGKTEAVYLTVLKRSPTITSVSPGEVYAGSKIIISGNDFGTKPDSMYQFYLNGKHLDWFYVNSSNWNNNSLEITVPKETKPGNYDLQITLSPGPRYSNRASFVVIENTCKESDWQCGNWGSCSSVGSQTRTCNKIKDCAGGVLSPATTQSCTYAPPCNADTWSCSDWSSCSASGIQNRSCTKTFDCSSVQTAAPITDQYCEAPSRPQQAPPSESDEISNQDTIIKATVKLWCPADNYKASQGSGTVIDSSGTILTNKHVIAGTLGCLVGFIDGFNDEPYFGDKHIADITKISPTQDAAILKMRNPKNARLSYVDVTKGTVNFSLGTKIMTYGYPAKFGTKITYTSGDFSGTDGSYLKTTAILEYGNSGGGAYLKNGTFIGIPSAVVKGQLNAMGYLLSIDTIKAWLNNSSIVSGNTNNNYSRVSILEDVDLNKLDSFRLFIPDVDEKGNLSASATNKNSQKATEQPQPSQAQKESTIPEQSSLAPSEQGKENKEENKNNSNITVSEQRRSIVANAVQEIIKVAERNGGIGQEIKVIAQTQTQNQEKLEAGIQKIQSRSGFAKFFIGPNYGEIKNSQKLLEQNKEQIQKLNEARTQIMNQGDQLQIIEQIEALEQVSQQIETSLNESQKGFSLFGWVFRLFN
ncbi:MAG: trypsin-like peptidase domain-containing protein [Patescibacteria group bacterium]